MRIATLQFSPVLGEVEQNIARADGLIEEADLTGERAVDLLVLPELAFSGYNFPSLSAITPYLEPTAAGPTAKWAFATAKHFNCIVSVGYPERASSPANPSTAATYNYNSTLTVSPTRLLAHYRKTHLYYTDESWAFPSPEGFITKDLLFPKPPESLPPSASTSPCIPTAFGICMDLNPHLFLSPSDAYEFSTHALETNARLIVCSMAWLTSLSAEELDLPPEALPPCPSEPQAGIQAEDGEDEDEDSTHEDSPGLEADNSLRFTPDTATLSCWLSRFAPLITAPAPTLIVLANRCGIEPGSVAPPRPNQHPRPSPSASIPPLQPPNNTSPPPDPPPPVPLRDFPKCARFPATSTAEVDGANAPSGVEEARYAGSSCVLRVGGGAVRFLGMMGRGEEGVGVWDVELGADGRDGEEG